MKYVILSFFWLQVIWVCSSMTIPLQPLPYDTLVPQVKHRVNNQKLHKTQATSEYANVHCALEDRSGAIWFGTTGEGLYRYDGTSFTNYLSEDGLANNDVWSVYEDQEGTIWLGTGAGLCRFNEASLHDTTIKAFIHIPFSAVWSIFQDQTGDLWIGTSEGIYVHEGEVLSDDPRHFKPFLTAMEVLNPNQLHLRHIQEILEDKQGNMWFASWNREGVCRYDGKTLTNYFPENDGMVHALLEDRRGIIWAGTRDHGAVFFDGENFYGFQNTPLLKSACVYALVEDIEGNIWFGTEANGAWVYHPSKSKGTDSDEYKQLTVKEGLINNSVFCLVRDKTGTMWFGTRNTGLCSYDGKTFTHYSE